MEATITCMSAGQIDEPTRRAIDAAMGQVLREVGIVRPPVSIEAVLSHLEVDREFYNLADPGLLRRLWHKFNVQGQQILQVVRKVSLVALWLPEERRILVDLSLPEPKKRWASFHDTTHRILDWHRPYYLWDTAQTLDPAYQEMLESEANYGASVLMFCGQSFKRDALDTEPQWASIEALKKTYGTSLVTTLRRYVEDSHDKPMAMMVSTAHWQEKPCDQPHRCRHFVGSPRFCRQFQRTVADTVLAEIDAHTRERRGGPVGEFTLSLEDDAGRECKFTAESFFNHYYVLTLLVGMGAASPKRILVNRSI